MPPVLPFGVPVNGFHPQMTAVPNPLGPIPPLPPPTGASRRKWAAPSTAPSDGSVGGADSSLSSCSSSRGSSGKSSASATLSSFIDEHTYRLVNRLRDDVRDEERHRRRMVRKRRRKDEESSSESGLSSRSSGAALRSVASGNSRSTRSGGDKKRQRRSYKESPREISYGPLAETKRFPTPSSVPAFTPTPSTERGPTPFGPKTPCYESCASSASPLSWSGSDTDQTNNVCGVDSFSDLYSEVFLQSERPQLIATLGGRIVAWNDEFLAATGLLCSQLRGSVTVHNLVEPIMQSRLNDMFEIALRGGEGAGKGQGGSSSCEPVRPPLVVIAGSDGAGGRGGLGGRRELQQVSAPTAAAVMTPADTPAPATPAGDAPVVHREQSNLSDLTDGSGIDAVAGAGGGSSDDSDEAATARSGANGSSEEEEGETHLSMTLPCRAFRFTREQLCITIILMNDIDPSKCCFYCILAPPPTPPPQSIAFPAPLHGMMGAGSYNPTGHGWYSGLQMPIGGGVEAPGMPAPLTPLMPLMQLPAAPSPILGKIRRIGQRTLASLL